MRVDQNVETQISNIRSFVLLSQVKVKVKFSLEQAMKAQKGSKGIALLFL